MKINLTNIFNQTDPRWKDILLGYNTSLPYNFYNYACLLCTQASILNYYGKNINPMELNEMLKANKGFQENTGNYIWHTITKIFPDIEEKVVNVPDPNPLTQEQVNEIKNAVDLGFPVAILIDYDPKTVKPNFHYVAIVDYDTQDENNFTIADPLTGTTHSLKDYLGWFRPSVRDTIQQYIIYSGLPPKNMDDGLYIPKKVNEDNVHGSSQWDAVISYLQLGDPKNSYFYPKVKDILVGYQRDRNNLSLATQQISSKITDIDYLNKKIQELDAIHQTEVAALSKGDADITTLRAVYQKNILDLNSQIDKLTEENKILYTKISQSQTTANNPTIPITQPTKGSSGLLDLLSNFLSFFQTTADDYAKLNRSK